MSYLKLRAKLSPDVLEHLLKLVRELEEATGGTAVAEIKATITLYAEEDWCYELFRELKALGYEIASSGCSQEDDIHEHTYELVLGQLDSEGRFLKEGRYPESPEVGKLQRVSGPNVFEKLLGERRGTAED